MSDESAAMNLPIQPTELDYETIHDAVMESQRGRWFLQEYARRNRNADTALLLAAIERIESMLRRQRAQLLPPVSSFTDLRDTIERARKTPDPIKPAPGRSGKLANADSLARSLESVIAQLRGTIRPLRDAAYAMREEGVRDRFCGDVEACAAELTRNFSALERAATAILALVREPAAREGESVVPAATGPSPISSQPVLVAPVLPEPAAARTVLPRGIEQSPPHAAPLPAAPKADDTTRPVGPAPTPLMPAVDIRAEPTSPPHKIVEAGHGPIELPFASLGGETPEPVATAEQAAPELPITPTFAPADFMPEPALEIVEPPSAPEPPSPAPAASVPAPLSPVVEQPPPPPPPLPTQAAPAPAKQPAPPAPRADKSALAPIIALSDEEKIALFS